MEKIYIHCDTISQFKALREIQHSFLTEGVLNLEIKTISIVQAH